MSLVRRNFNDLFVLSRPGSATYWGSDGKLHVAGPNEPRFHYDPVTGESLGLLVEKEATNLITRSYDFGSSYWTKNKVTVQSNATTAPDGTNTGSALIVNEDVSFPTSLVASPVVATLGEHYTLSFFVKSTDIPRTIEVVFASNANLTSDRNRVYFDTSSGEISSATAVLGTEVVLSIGGWYKVTIRFQSLFSGTARCGLTSAAQYNPGLLAHIWGAQLTLGSQSGSHIITNGTAVTRPADILTRQVSTPTFNPNEGTFLIKSKNHSNDIIYLDGFATEIVATGGGGTMVYKYGPEGATVFSSNETYSDDGPISLPQELIPTQNGNLDLRLLSYRPLEISNEEAESLVTGDFTTQGWNAEMLYKNGESIIWPNIGDVSTMFQDNRGTTPVTQPGQTVGLIFDRTQGLASGINQCVNPMFLDGTTGWSTLGGVSVSSTPGLLTLDGGASSGGLYQDIPVENYSEVIIRCRKASGTSQTYLWIDNKADFDESGMQYYQEITSDEFEDYKFIVDYPEADPGFTRVYMQVYAGDGKLEVQSVSVKDIKGNHLYQDVSGSRPLLGITSDPPERNLLTNTDLNSVNFVDNGTSRTPIEALDSSNFGSLLTVTGEFSRLAVPNAQLESVLPPNADVVFSLYVKEGSHNRTFTRYQNRDGIGYELTYNFENDSLGVSGGTFIDYGRTNEGDGWFRIWMKVPTGAGVGAQEWRVFNHGGIYLNGDEVSLAQPQIELNDLTAYEIVDVLNGKMNLLFNGTSHFFKTRNIDVNNATGITVSVGMEKTSTNEQTLVESMDISNGPGGKISMKVSSGGNDVFTVIDGNENNITTVIETIGINERDIYLASVETSTGSGIFRRGNDSSIPGTVGSEETEISNAPVIIGASYDGSTASNYFSGRIYSFMIRYRHTKQRNMNNVFTLLSDETFNE